MMKHVAADAKEKFGNMTAKAEEKMDKAKACGTEKITPDFPQTLPSYFPAIDAMTCTRSIRG